ncbi:hypothetical protein DNU06_10085 [Putridiphycobacter roseus]|uniref:DUF6998 domain-containing protein n=1 Tax=Putridiphycobacter roseus TaxID=2219161 RepID=A0A2W1ND96_9FLAO|nr:hypothetical protein [Putridiphycobacter roseus]PZE17083.1 hypothetical protein DNU06_10085 [Putridiphycobacter roseus]
MEEIKQLLEITRSLQEKYGRKFTLDGKLVGDIGEVLTAEAYNLTLFSENEPIHDAITIDGLKRIQIKASFKNYSYFPSAKSKIPDYFLSVNILENGELEELFNGPGQFIYDKYIIGRNLKPTRETFYNLSKGVLIKLNAEVPEKDKIKRVK